MDINRRKHNSFFIIWEAHKEEQDQSKALRIGALDLLNKKYIKIVTDQGKEDYQHGRYESKTILFVR